MTLASITLNQILIVFIIILIGVICFKMKLIDKETNKKLSNILLMLINPLVIFVSYQREFSKELLDGLIISLFLALATHIFAILISQLLLRKKQNSDIDIERFSAIYSNCGFMGIPLVNGIIGIEGVFYLTAYITIFNIFVWTHGIFIMVGKQERKELVKILLSPTLISIFLGFIFFITQIKIPDVLLKSLDYVAAMNTPLAMIIAGVTIAQTSLKDVFNKARIYLVSFIKLLFIPLMLILLFSILPISETVLITTIIAVACPTGATGTMFALRFNKNSIYASEIFTLTTLFSLITIPIVTMLIDLIT